MSKDDDQPLGRNSPLLAIGPLLPESDSLPRTRPHLHHPSIPDVLASSLPIWWGDLDQSPYLIADYPSPGMPLTHFGRKPFVVFDFLASFGMGVVIDHWSSLFGIGMERGVFEAHVAVGSASSANGQ